MYILAGFMVGFIFGIYVTVRHVPQKDITMIKQWFLKPKKARKKHA